MRVETEAAFGKDHAVALTGTLVLHTFAVIILLFGLPERKNIKKKSEPVMPVSIIETSPREILTATDHPQPQNKFTPVKNKKIKKKIRHKTLKKYGSNPVDTKKQTEEKQTDTTPDIDCSMFDEAACSPCLADPELCKKCCASKKEVKTKNTAKIDTSSGCKNPPCKKDPCTPEAVSEMASSFCPKVRGSIYSKLGLITLKGIKQGTYLSSRIAVTVSPSGRLSLAGVLRSSGNAVFDSAVKKAVVSSGLVLPPAKLTSCVASRGCVFNVTIGSKPVKSGKKVIKLKNTDEKSSSNNEKSSISVSKSKMKQEKNIMKASSVMKSKSKSDGK